jgi:hypothetical protein
MRLQGTGMSYKQRFQTTIPNVYEKIDEFLELNDAEGKIENDIGKYKGSGVSGIPASSGWATLTVNTSDGHLINELNDFFLKLDTEFNSQFGL